MKVFNLAQIHILSCHKFKPCFVDCFKSSHHFVLFCKVIEFLEYLIFFISSRDHKILVIYAKHKALTKQRLYLLIRL